MVERSTISQRFTHYLTQINKVSIVDNSLAMPSILPHKTESSSSIDLLPTNLDIATKGARSFAAMTMTAGEIISPRLSLFLYASDPYADLIANCFVGTTPEVTIIRERMINALLKQTNPVSRSEAKRIIDSFEYFMNQIPGFAAVSGKKTVHFINLEAIYQVIANYPTYFTGITPANFLPWFKKYFVISKATADKTIQYGLISGFSLKSTLDYKYYLRGTEKLAKQSSQMLAHYVKAVQVPVDEEMVNLVVKMLTDLIPEEKSALLNAKRFMWSNLPQFTSLSHDDEEYMMELNSLYEASGIRGSFRQIHAYLAERLPDHIRP